jgi:DNA-binding CsgD family transcriptional regulator
MHRSIFVIVTDGETVETFRFGNGKAPDTPAAQNQTHTYPSDTIKELIVGELRKGISSREIAERLHLPVAKVAAHKAHLTMGTYGR